MDGFARDAADIFHFAMHGTMVGASAFILGVFLIEAGMEHEAVDDFRHAFLQLFHLFIYDTDCGHDRVMIFAILQGLGLSDRVLQRLDLVWIEERIVLCVFCQV